MRIGLTVLAIAVGTAGACTGEDPSLDGECGDPCPDAGEGDGERGEGSAVAPTVLLETDPTVTIVQGKTAAIKVTITRPAGYVTPLTISVSNLPAGVTASKIELQGDGRSGSVELTAGLQATQGEVELVLSASDPEPRASAKTKLHVRGAPGALDTTFASTGKLTLPTSPRVYQLAVRPDGKAILGGTDGSTGGKFMVVRVDSAGALDATFGMGGIVENDLGENTAGVLGVAISGNVNAVAFGRSLNLDGANYGYALARYDDKGAGDATLGGGDAGPVGTVVLRQPGTKFDSGSVLDCRGVLDPSGNVIVLGLVEVLANPPPNTGLFATRITAAGALDTAFANGKVNGTGAPVAIVRSAGGQFVYASRNGTTNSVGRMTSTGIADANFGDASGTPGSVVTGLTPGGANTAHLSSLAAYADGAPLLGGYEPSASKSYVKRLIPNGLLADDKFGSLGTTTLEFGASTKLLALVLEPTTNVVWAAGFVGSGATQSAFVAKLGPSGNLDPDFGDGGKVLVPTGGGFEFVALAQQADGRLWVNVGRPLAGGLLLRLWN